MIFPSDFRPDMSLEEAIEAYRENGFSKDDARVYARILAGPNVPDLPII